MKMAANEIQSNFRFINATKAQNAQDSMAFTCDVLLPNLDSFSGPMEAFLALCKLEPCVYVTVESLSHFASKHSHWLKGTGYKNLSTDGPNEDKLKQIFMSPDDLLLETGFINDFLFTSINTLIGLQTRNVANLVKGVNFVPVDTPPENLAQGDVAYPEAFKAELAGLMDAVSCDIEDVIYNMAEVTRYTLRVMQYGFGFDEKVMLRKFIAAGYMCMIRRQLLASIGADGGIEKMWAAIMPKFPKNHPFLQYFKPGADNTALKAGLKSMTIQSVEYIMTPHNAKFIEGKLVESGY